MTPVILSPEMPPQMRISCGLYHEMIAKGVLTPEHRVELIDGYLIKKMSIGSPHASAVKALNFLLSRELGGNAVIGVQDPVTIHEYSEPEPDLVVAKYRPDFYRSAHPGPDDVLLVIEVADSSLAYDRQAKIPLYAACGIPETWLVNLVDKNVTVYRKPDGNTYTDVRTYGASEAIDIPNFPGRSIAVADLGL